MRLFIGMWASLHTMVVIVAIPLCRLWCGLHVNIRVAQLRSPKPCASVVLQFFKIRMKKKY